MWCLLLLTVFIHSIDRGPPNRQLSEGLPEGRRDVVPAFSCRETRALEVGLYLVYYCLVHVHKQ